MKKLYSLLIIAFVGFVGNAQIVNIPDVNFKAKLLAASETNQIASTDTPDANGFVDNYTIVDTNADGEIQVSEALAIKRLDVNYAQISDLTGIESFSNLLYIDCSSNPLVSLDIISGLTNLKVLKCGYSQFGGNQFTSIDVHGLTNLQRLECAWSDLTNIDVSGLINLQILDCSHNQFPSLNVSGLTNLQKLNCSHIGLPSLDVNGLTNLQELNCVNNQLTSLNLSGLTNLLNLDCGSNQLPSIDVSGLIYLQNFDCSYNQLPSIDLNGLTNLGVLNCSNNQLPSLNVSGLTNLVSLDCGSNQFSSIDVIGLINLIELNCSGNQLQSLNISGLTNLQGLDCSNNQLSTLDLSGLVNLQFLGFEGNQLTSIDLTGLTNLTYLDCSYNAISNLSVNNLINLNNLKCNSIPITTLDVSALAQLSFLSAYNDSLLTSLFIKNSSNEVNGITLFGDPNLQYICADEEQIASIQNLINTYGYTNCHVNSYCSFTPGGAFYTIQGNNRYDNNNNGCDAGDINYPNLKLSFTDGTNIGNLIADTTGAYRYDVQAGTQTITPTLETPTYFNISPTTSSVTFPTTTSPFVQDFCITANGVHNDLEVSLFPMNVARPGFDVAYKIIYKNKGTASQSGTLNLAFDDAKLDFVSAVPSITSQATNSLNWSFSNLLPFETREILVTLNVNSPTETPAVNSGDVLPYTVTVVGATDETPTDNVATLNQTVINSLDPNDKTCVEGTTVSPSMVGNYVHYVIHFENDGTANAQNIVVKDMIDASKFDINSLIPLSGSASYTTTIKNTNQVEFVFQNINLPFAAGTNTSYVAFKIKTKPTLVVGDTFSNSANIYFDYNFPITTNTATTTIATLGNQDFDFGSVFTLSPVPAKNGLTITTKRDMIVTSLSIYNTLGQVVEVNTNPNETIDVSGLQSGSYFIRITSDKGSATGKFIKE